MSLDLARNRTDDEQTEPLDPMEFFPDAASRIGGLGGGLPPPHPAYAFHTRYVTSRGGAMVFTLRFQGLRATFGKLSLSVNAYPENGGEVEVIAAETVHLPNLIHDDGLVRFHLETTGGTNYALLGHVFEDSDVAVDTLTIDLTRSDASRHYTRKLIAARPTIFGLDAVRAMPRLISHDKATLVDPVSQMCTLAQFDEPLYRHWIDRMGLSMRRHRKEWEFVYILQALHRYGVLQPGARGLGFGVGREPLPAVMAAAGCTVVATDLPVDHADVAGWAETHQHVASLDGLRRPDICPDALLEERVRFRAVDMTALPDDLTHFDFVWSSCAYEHLGSIAAGLRFVEASIECLKPGGVAVHTSELNLSSNDATVAEGMTVLFRRRDMERLAVTLVSHGHEVAQFKYDFGDTPQDYHVDVPPYAADNHLKLALEEYVTTSFGIIVRRGLRT